MTIVAAIIALLATVVLAGLWWQRRPIKGCVCGRCHATLTALPRCLVSGADTVWIEFRKGPMGGRSVQLVGTSLRIGSVASNDVVLSDPAVSEQHLAIERDSKRVLVRDLASTNGLYVNGVRAKSMVLAADDRLTFGNSEAVVRFR